MRDISSDLKEKWGRDYCPSMACAMTIVVGAFVIGGILLIALAQYGVAVFFAADFCCAGGIMALYFSRTVIDQSDVLGKAEHFRHTRPELDSFALRREIKRQLRAMTVHALIAIGVEMTLVLLWAMALLDMVEQMRLWSALFCFFPVAIIAIFGVGSMCSALKSVDDLRHRHIHTS